MIYRYVDPVRPGFYLIKKDINLFEVLMTYLTRTGFEDTCVQFRRIATYDTLAVQKRIIESLNKNKEAKFYSWLFEIDNLTLDGEMDIKYVNTISDVIYRIEIERCSHYPRFINVVLSSDRLRDFTDLLLRTVAVEDQKKMLFEEIARTVLYNEK